MGLCESDYSACSDSAVLYGNYTHLPFDVVQIEKHSLGLEMAALLSSILLITCEAGGGFR